MTNRLVQSGSYLPAFYMRCLVTILSVGLCEISGADYRYDLSPYEWLRLSVVLRILFVQPLPLMLLSTETPG